MVDKLDVRTPNGKAFKITGDTAGMETLLLLARPNPLLATDAEIRGWFAGFKPLSFRGEKARAWFDEIRPLIAPHLVGDVVHDHFGVVVPRQVIVVIGEELIAEFGKIGELSVEPKGKTFPLAAVPPLERLRVAACGAPAGGVTRVPNRGPAGVFLHDRRVFAPIVDSKCFDDGADFLVRIDQFVPFRVVGGHSGGKLAAVLEIEQHAGHVAGELVRVSRPDGRPVGSTRQVIQGRHAAFVLQFVHVTAVVSSACGQTQCWALSTGCQQSRLKDPWGKVTTGLIYWKYRTFQGGKTSISARIPASQDTITASERKSFHFDLERCQAGEGTQNTNSDCPREIEMKSKAAMNGRGPCKSKPAIERRTLHEVPPQIQTSCPYT